MSKMICLCNRISTKDVEKVISKHPGAKFQDIIKLTSASTSCGRCRTELKIFIEQIKSIQSSTSQLTIPFDF